MEIKNDSNCQKMKTVRRKYCLKCSYKPLIQKQVLCYNYNYFCVTIYRTSVINCEKDDEWYLRSVTLSVIP